MGLQPLPCPWVQGLHWNSVHEFPLLPELWCRCTTPYRALIVTLIHALTSQFGIWPAWGPLNCDLGYCHWSWLTCTWSSCLDLLYHHKWSGLWVGPPQTWLLVSLMSCGMGEPCPADWVILGSSSCRELPALPDPWPLRDLYGELILWKDSSWCETLPQLPAQHNESMWPWGYPVCPLGKVTLCIKAVPSFSSPVW